MVVSPRGVLALVLCLVWPAAAQIAPETSGRLHQLIESALRQTGAPAISAAAFSGSGPIWAAAHGFADLENSLPAHARSVFRFASVSKPITAMAAMRLVEAGKLDLDAPIQKALPDFPEKPWPVTLRLLLAHQAGIRHYQGDEFASTRHYGGVKEGLAIFSSDPLLQEPGTKYVYSTYGINLAGAAIEAAAGEPYARYVARTILAPAGSEAIRPDSVFDLIPNRVRGYSKDQAGAVINCSLADTSNKLPGGGWVGTAEDLVRVGIALMEGRILRAESMRIMWQPVPLRDGKPNSYGLCWNVGRRGDVEVYSHSGGQQGASTYFLVAPARRIAVAVLINLDSVQADELAFAMLEELLKEKP